MKEFFKTGVQKGKTYFLNFRVSLWSSQEDLSWVLFGFNWEVLVVGFTSLSQEWGEKALKAELVPPKSSLADGKVHCWFTQKRIAESSLDILGLDKWWFCFCFVMLALASPFQFSFCLVSQWFISPFPFSFVCSIIAGLTWRHEASLWKHHQAVSQPWRGGTAGTVLPPSQEWVNHPLNMQYHPGQEPGFSTGTWIPASLETLFPHFGQTKRQ